MTKDLRQAVLVMSAKKGLRERMGEVKERLAEVREVRKRVVQENQAERENRERENRVVEMENRGKGSFGEGQRRRKDALVTRSVGRKGNVKV